MEPNWLIVGLGNPGAAYERTRHNIGFMLIDALARESQTQVKRVECRSLVGRAEIEARLTELAKPQTFMNLSGAAVREVVNWYHLPLDETIVAMDDLDIPFATLRMRGRGSAGGHNGLASIIEQIGTNEIPRLKIGIGRGRSSASSHVLSRFSPDQERALPDLVARATDAVELWVRDGLVAAMNEANKKTEQATNPPPPDRPV